MSPLQMEVYSPSLELIDILREIRSLVYEEKAFSAGSFTLDARITEEVLALLKPDNIIWFRGTSAGIVEYLEQREGEDGLYITAKGSMLTGILDRRILWGQYDLSGPPEKIMRRLVDDSAVNPTKGSVEARKIPGLVLAAEGTYSGESIRKRKIGGSLLETLETMAEAYQVAFGVAFHPQIPEMEFWTRAGVDRTIDQTDRDPVQYSTDLHDVLTAKYTYNSGNSRNIALVAGEGEGAGRTYVVVPSESGGSGAAAFIPKGETVALLTADGKELLAKAVSAQEAAGYLSAYTGQQIDEAVRIALSGGTGGGGTAGVSSFNGRTGAVIPKTGDYTAEMLGAATMAQVNAAINAAILDSWEGSY